METKIKKKIVVLSGAGVSAESGLGTYRDNGGLWDNYDPMEVASIQGWRTNPGKVLDFYNMQREKLASVKPNAAHLAIAALEKDYNVTVITQNVDNLHERAGSTKVIHLHGEATKVRPDHGVYDTHGSEAEVQDVGYSKVSLGDRSRKGVQLRPHIVFFGEDVPRMKDAAEEVSTADVVIIIGTSMTVYPAASLYTYAPSDCRIYYIDPKDVPVWDDRIIHIRKKASEGMKIFTIEETGRKIVRQFLSTVAESYAPQGYTGAVPGGEGKFIMYAVSSLWLNALRFSRLTGDEALQKELSERLKPYLAEKRGKCSKMNHVDFSVFGSVPLEVYNITGSKPALEAGLCYADHQWEAPDPEDTGDTGNADYTTQMRYLEEGFSPQSRFWIEDMYMITVLQTQAYLATDDMKYIERTAKEMAVYLSRMQLPDGLFNHTVDAPFKWGRGNGWVAGGMPLLLRYLPKDNEHRPRIEAAFTLMMGTLLKYQHPSGLWGQIVDDPEAWDESSCSAMFTSAFFSGINCGLLDPDIYLPAAQKAWEALCAKIDKYGNVADVGAGINSGSDRMHYLTCPKVNGAPHGQAAMLWTINAMLEGSNSDIPE